jgi:hypothetical protein
VGNAEVSGGGRPEMAKAGEPEISNKKKSEISRVVESTISNVGKAENPSAGCPDHSSWVLPVLSTDEILARNRERERQLSIETALASSLSDGFGLDEL